MAVVHIGNDEIVALTGSTWPTIQQREAPEFQMATFGLLCAHFGASMQQTGGHIAQSLYHAGEQFHGWYPDVPNPSPAPEPEQPPAPEPRPLEALHVMPDRRWFNVDLRFAQAFGLAGKARTQGNASILPFLDVLARERFNGIHVIASGLDPEGYWAPCAIGPTLPGHWDALEATVAAAAERGIYTQFIIFGGLVEFGGPWRNETRLDVYRDFPDVQRRAQEYAFQLVDRYAQNPAVLWNLSNEPDQIGFRHSFDLLVDLGRRLSGHTSQPMTFSSPGAELGHEALPFLTDGADVHSAHLDRRHFDGEQTGWVGVKRAGEHPSIDQDRMPFWHDEPWNRGEGPTYYGRQQRHDWDLSTATAFCDAAHSRCRQYTLSFHCDGALFGNTLGPQTIACMRAHHAGLDAIPRLVGDKWRGHHARSFIKGAPYASDDEPRAVRQHVERGNLWRVVGTHDYAVSICEHRDFDMRRFGAGRIVHREVYGQYAAGVYRP